MNQRFDPNENRNVNPASWPADKASQRIDPATPATDQLANPRQPETIEQPRSRSSWPILIILLAGLVLALLVWLPTEMSNSPADNTATPPATTGEQTTTPPADNSTTATPPADNSTTATPPADNSTTTTPPADNSMTTTPPAGNATPATPDTQKPATNNGGQAPATGTAPQN